MRSVVKSIKGLSVSVLISDDSLCYRASYRSWLGP
jgi:hypothetical protein